MSNTLIDIQNISKFYNNHKALDKITFSIQSGEICGLVGENGAGKTTLIRIMSGLIKANSGQVDFMHQVNMSSIVESPSLYPNLSGWDNLHYACLSLGIKNYQHQIKDILKLVGLEGVSPSKKVKDYSLGMRQRLAIGLAVIDSPKFLILDEPINGLDPSGIKEMRELLLRLKNDFAITILISSHILSELDLIVDRYIIMHKGKVLIEVPKKKIS